MLSKPDLIFKQWVTSLQNRDKTRTAIQGNFYDLFWALKGEGLILESAYEYLEKAIKAHSPTPALIKNVYKKLKLSGRAFGSEEEFQDSWCKDIADKANISFFEVFPIEIKEPEPEPIIYGNMTAKEYKAQRKHAEEYPRLDINEFKSRMLAEDYNPVADITAAMRKNGNTI